MLTLQETKLHLRVDDDAEDALLLGLIAAATLAVGDHINSPVPLDNTAPAPIKSAALLLVGDLYLWRESQTDRPLTDNRAFERLLAPYRVYQ
ncbi:head-tail connector protein [Simplicispira psychrophila]|uniref:head-tail connector protein n=1 Tax=Simplicispira psychrophila TaxID=80882 RepID=UPI0004838D83|nr:head-tail connector protein [Simplicispira psychrophila]